MTICSNQERDGTAVRIGLPCTVDLYQRVDIGWRVEQRLKREVYEAYRRRYADCFRMNQLRINPLLKDWIS